MSPRLCFLVFALLPILARGRGGHGRGGGGHSSHGHGGYGHSGGSHSYPSGGGLSGYGTHHQSASYPHSNTGLSGNNAHNSYGTQTHHTTTVHHHHYSPPTQVHYGSGYHPVYQGSPPVYVYTYRDSGSRFDNLLTGLALYNLGRMSSNHDHYHHYSSSSNSYSSNPGEVCKFQIIKTNGEYEETKIDCQLMSSFIWDAEREKEMERNRVVNTNTNTVTTVNVTTVERSGDNNSSVVTTSVQNTSTVVDALKAKGPSIQVTPGMSCFMVRNYRGSVVKKKVDCGLLQQYATSSFRNNSSRNKCFLSLVIFMSSLINLV